MEPKATFALSAQLSLSVPRNFSRSLNKISLELLKVSLTGAGKCTSRWTRPSSPQFSLTVMKMMRQDIQLLKLYYKMNKAHFFFK